MRNLSVEEIESLYKMWCNDPNLDYAVFMDFIRVKAQEEAPSSEGSPPSPLEESSGSCRSNDCKTSCDVDPVKLSEEHWEWVHGLFKYTYVGVDDFNDCAEYLYKTAFVHGWKHCEEYYSKN